MQGNVTDAAWRGSLVRWSITPGGSFPHIDEPPAVALTAGDVARIAAAVVDEQERREASPLRVTAADRRRWMP